MSLVNLNNNSLFSSIFQGQVASKFSTSKELKSKIGEKSEDSKLSSELDLKKESSLSTSLSLNSFLHLNDDSEAYEEAGSDVGLWSIFSRRRKKAKKKTKPIASNIKKTSVDTQKLLKQLNIL